jgi:ABC-type uncharacterized transport system auxiliary subunit
MDFKSVRKRITAAKKGPRAKNASLKVRIERTVGVVLVVLMGAAAMMLAARRPEAGAATAMTSKVVAPVEETAPAGKASVSRTQTKASAPKNGSANAVVAAPVTITGCLEQDDDVFKLKNTDGLDAPTSRSWKSGFLKKRPATITVLDASHKWKLEKHIGERISVTGSIIDREMQVRSLSRVTSSCA